MLSLTVPSPAIRWIVIVASVALILFNVADMPYEGLYDNSLIVVGFVINVVAIVHAWRWTAPGV